MDSLVFVEQVKGNVSRKQTKIFTFQLLGALQAVYERLAEFLYCNELIIQT